jgi:AcrR family transcriptional regulator
MSKRGLPVSSRRSWQEERRAINREAILDGARAAFERKGYLLATVDDILAEARIGRTSFYKHFPDKLAVVRVLFERFGPELERAYGALGASETPSDRTVRLWLAELVRFYAQHAPVMRVFAQATLAEAGFGQAIADSQRRLMALLARRLPKFRVAAHQSDGGPEWTRASLVLRMVDHYCSVIALQGVTYDPGEGIDFMAGIVSDFISPGFAAPSDSTAEGFS